MKCRQCNKPVSHECNRSDCLASESAARQRWLDDLKARQEHTLNQARQNFRPNFDKVAAWSEANGWTKPEQRGTNYRAASETDRGKLVIQAIARSM